MNDLFNETVLEQNELRYKSNYYAFFENYNKEASSAESDNRKHWREYTSYLTEEENMLEKAVNFKQGILLDCLFNAEYYNNRLNDMIVVFNEELAAEDTAITDIVKSYIENPDKQWDEQDIITVKYILKDDFYQQQSSVQNRQARKQAFEKEIENLGNGYELSRKSAGEIKVILAEKLETINNYNKVYDNLAESYLLEAEKLADSGQFYDSLYKELKTLYNTMENFRKEYEKQDAIKRWAGTSYLESSGEGNENLLYKNPVQDLLYSQDQLNRARIALNVLEDMYEDDDSRRPYYDSSYENIYKKYEESFTRMITSMKALAFINAAVQSEGKKTKAVYENLQNLLSEIMTVPSITKDYTAPENQQNWGINDLIRVQDGLLKFSYNDDFVINKTTANTINALVDYFESEIDVNGEWYPAAALKKR
jgi:hypothetical protein